MRFNMRVVFPAPRNPVMTVMGVGGMVNGSEGGS